METLSDKQRDRWPPYCPLQSSFFLTVTPNIITSRPIGHSEPRDVQGDHILYFILFPLGLRACQFKGPHPFIGNQFVPHSGGVDSINEPIGRWRILKRIIKTRCRERKKRLFLSATRRTAAAFSLISLCINSRAPGAAESSSSKTDPLCKKGSIRIIFIPGIACCISCTSES